jgi:hypothetical protein
MRTRSADLRLDGLAEALELLDATTEVLRPGMDRQQAQVRRQHLIDEVVLGLPLTDDAKLDRSHCGPPPVTFMS